MSAGYASRLRDYPHKGVCGLAESTDTVRAYDKKLAQLVSLIQKEGGSPKIVAFTGAGISTAAGIPDFRGPSGIWTLEEKKKKRKRPVATTGKTADEKVNNEDTCSMDFTAAQPTLTHRAITRLIRDNVFHYCITQNVDGLHKRSGLSRQHHSILHGCVFTETCETCQMEHFRDFDCGGMSFQKTGRQCDECGGDLCDTLLDWEDPLPEHDLQRAEHECSAADLVLCLGTSLRIEPANQLPLQSKKCVIVNLQKTPMDKEAAIVIRQKVDTFMTDLMEKLGYESSWVTEDDPPIERYWKVK